MAFYPLIPKYKSIKEHQLMSRFSDEFNVEFSPKARRDHMIVRNGVRFTVLTPCLIRIENQGAEKFCDEPTQSVWFRDFDSPVFAVNEGGGHIAIKTEKINLLYSLSLKKVVRIKLRDGRTVTDFNSGNLKGTCRTLDVSAGAPILGDGIISKNGVAVLDDSDSLVLRKNGEIASRDYKERDVYYFAYGYDYIGATRDLYKLTGKTPLLPRFALSNWWSRYKAYTQDEYLALMDRFIKEQIPITVATVDMDWHWVDIKKKFGSESHKMTSHKNFLEYFYDAWSPGWTGYSFNTDLFPDPEGFLKKLKADGFKVTFNLHPSQGVRWFENSYEEMCRAMGLDPKTKKPVKFDITNEKFVENYFKILHHPYEKMGVDFWWIDWQQGTRSKIPGLDPLWALNHYHYIDNGRDKKRPLILSRFAGVGSQRYPVGFSGDTVQMWRSLDFQPYFTATAANIGYPWWSHDIGGHCMGKKDDELYIRWVQFGVFSPIMRLHSTSNEFMGKEPWKYSGTIERIAKYNLRLRHKLLPYIYTMNRRTESLGRAICEPMYYEFPKNEEAYAVKNQYFFGTELIVAPITEHTSSDNNMAGVNVWLPEGRFTDVFTGRIYSGSRFVKMYRDVEYIPVLAKEGAIIPLSENCTTNDTKNPESLEVLIYRGNNTFRLYEDDGETLKFKNGAFSETPFSVKESGTTLEFSIGKAEGDISVLPQKRKYILRFKDVVSCDVTVRVNGRKSSCDVKNEDGTTVVTVKNVSPEDSVSVGLSTCDYLANMPKKEALIETISKYQMGNDSKGRLFTDFVLNGGNIPPVAEDFSGPIEEILALYRG